MFYKCGLLLLTILLLLVSVCPSQVHYSEENGVKSAVYLSPKFVLGAGSVVNQNFPNIDFPRGHIALKEFSAEVVDQLGNPVPLHQTYLHHWLLNRYYALINATDGQELKIIPVMNSGVCNVLGQYYGLGSETRKTKTHVPDPYGIELGNKADMPKGYVERWALVVHAIDTRGVVDKVACTECRCDEYNVTRDSSNEPLPAGYAGGLLCCYDQTQCRLRKKLQNTQRNLYVRYTVKWVDWVDTVLPVKIYIFDVTSTWDKAEQTENCQVEYDVKSCREPGASTNGCLDNKKTTIVMPEGGYLIYGVAHQHSGGVDSTLYGEDGRKLCASTAIYGKGKEAGNEKGYVVGMTTCYPKFGSVKISKGERLVLESNYSSKKKHIGVMGLFYILIADDLPKGKAT